MSAYDELPMLVRVADEPGSLRVNRVFEERLGLAVSDLEARPLRDWIHPEDRSSFEAALSTESGCVSARHETKDGEWLAFRWEVRTHGEGCVVLGRSEDPALEAQPNESRPPAQQVTLSQTLEAMARIVESQNPGMLCSILLMDSEGEYIIGGAGPSLPQEYNEAVEGLRIGPMVGSCGTAAFWNEPVIVEDISEDPLWKDLRDAAALAGVLACWSQPITNAHGETLGAIALYDRSPRAPTENQMRGLQIAAQMVALAIERDNLEDQLRQAAKMEAIGVLAGGIAHDFNNLLAVVRSNAELAVEFLPPASAAKSLLADVVSASASAGELCNQMLAYAGRGPIATEVVDCNGLVKELGGLLQVALSKKVTLDYRLSSVPLGVVADRAQFRQVIMNLITNASEAIGDETGEVVVETSSRRYRGGDPALLRPDGPLEPGDYVCLRVSDTGAGMDSKTMSKIFDPFFSTKATGRGLGLAAVQGIVMNHGGTILLETEEGSGTTFTVLLPRVPVAAAVLPFTPQHRQDPVGAHILVVDDERLIRVVMTKILEHAGYTVTCAEDGQEAVDLFRETPDAFECVLLDFRMPKLDGIEAFTEMREIRSDVPVILCSGYTEEEILDRFEGTGLTHALQKLQPMNVLLGKVAEVLETAGSERASPAG